MSSTDVKELGAMREQKTEEVEIENDDVNLPILYNVEEERLATGKSLGVSNNSNLNIARFPSDLPAPVAVGPTTRDETYQSDDEPENSKKYPSLVINAALRWYEFDLQQGGIMLFDWIRGQFQVFQSMQTFKHQRTFLALHQKNVKRLFAGMFNLLPVLKHAGIAHNNISLETIMLLAAPVTSLPDQDDLFAFIDSPPWFPLLTSFGCSSLAESYDKRSHCLQQEQFHLLFKENCPVEFDDDGSARTSTKIADIILSYARDHYNYTRYLAPEKNPVAPKGDLWSLGVLLWECLTNTFLWQKPKSKLYQHMVKKKGGFRAWFLEHVRNPGNNHLPYFVPKDALDLLNQIFKSERKRISLKDVLKHKFFFGYQSNTSKNIGGLGETQLRN